MTLVLAQAAGVFEFRDGAGALTSISNRLKGIPRKRLGPPEALRKRNSTTTTKPSNETSEEWDDDKLPAPLSKPRPRRPSRLRSPIYDDFRPPFAASMSHNAWLDRHQGTDHVTGSRTADMRSALVDYFREQGQINRPRLDPVLDPPAARRGLGEGNWPCAAPGAAVAARAFGLPTLRAMASALRASPASRSTTQSPPMVHTRARRRRRGRNGDRDAGED